MWDAVWNHLMNSGRISHRQRNNLFQGRGATKSHLLDSFQPNFAHIARDIPTPMAGIQKGLTAVTGNLLQQEHIMTFQTSTSHYSSHTVQDGAINTATLAITFNS